MSLASTAQRSEMALNIAQGTGFHRTQKSNYFYNKNLSGPKCQQCQGKKPRSTLVTLHQNSLACLPFLTEHECFTVARRCSIYIPRVLPGTQHMLYECFWMNGRNGEEKEEGKGRGEINKWGEMQTQGAKMGERKSFLSFQGSYLGWCKLPAPTLNISQKVSLTQCSKPDRLRMLGFTTY